MRIAFLGATSQISSDLILSFNFKSGEDELFLFARNVDNLNIWLKNNNLDSKYPAYAIEEFSNRFKFDVIINFIGVGNPAEAASMGDSIIDTTYKFDEMVLQSLINSSNKCKYIYLSSGAAYGSDFSSPVNAQSVAQVPINNLTPQDWYGISKLYAESRHRSMSLLPIVDIRIFNYFSHTQDMDARFLITDIIRSIFNNSLLKTSANPAVRDYITPPDFFQLIMKVINYSCINDVLDCYSRAPIEKRLLLEEMQAHFGLKYEVQENSEIINATGIKPYYYSENKRAERYGYYPEYSSLDGLLSEIKIYLSKHTN